MEKVRFVKERLYYFSPSMNVIVGANIEGPVRRAALETAIQKAVYTHKLLTARVVQDAEGIGYYEENEMPKKAELIYHEGSLQELINEQERSPFNLAEGETVRFFAIEQKGALQFIIIAQHMAGDGTAMLYLLKTIMEYLANPQKQEVQWPITCFSPEEIPQSGKLNWPLRTLVNYTNKKWNKDKHIFSYDEYKSMVRQYWAKRQTCYTMAYIPKEQVNKLLVLARENEITLNSVIATAFLKAAPEETNVSHASSIRKKDYEGMGNFATGISTDYGYNLKKSFWENAKEIHRLVYKKLNNPCKKYFFLSFISALEPSLIDAAYSNAYSQYENKVAKSISNMFGFTRAPHGMALSNLTKAPIPESYGAYKLTHLNFLAPLPSNANRVISVVTLSGIMTIGMQYLNNDAAKEQELFNVAIAELNRL